MSFLKPIKDPVEGSMHVVGATQLDAEVLRAPCTITYVIQAPGVEAFSGEQVFEIWSRQWPQPGDDLPVVFDREKTDRIEIQWDKVMDTSDSARLHADELAAQMREGAAAQPGQSTGAGQAGAPVITPIVIGNASPERIADAMAKAEQTLGIDLDGDGKIGGATSAGAAPAGGGAPSPAASAGGDLTSQLERLAKLRDSGALTEAEFESMKRKVIG
jgi:hypothetical protein